MPKMEKGIHDRLLTNRIHKLFEVIGQHIFDLQLNPSPILNKRLINLRPDKIQPYHDGCNFTSGEHQRDRKSTRLNSSHVAISYAVFCLKKKKIQNNRHPEILTTPRRTTTQ